MAQGFLGIVLHAHLPYVHHPEHEHFLEENWLFEALTECYLPLLGVLERLQAAQIDYRLTLSLSPTLITMLRDPLLQQRYQQHLNKLITLAELEIKRTRGQAAYQRLARLYLRFFRQTLQRYQQQYAGDLLSAFLQQQQSGCLELITTAATHGFLPLLNVSDTAVANQINVGLNVFSSQFDFKPAGFWLPECGYYPGLENTLKSAGINYFFVDRHSFTHATPPATHDVYAPVNCPNDLTAFARDPAASQQVWCAQQGYPGAAEYREYYRDLGFDLDDDTLKPFLIDGHIRSNTGIKYYRVTGNTEAKEPYDPRAALNRAHAHAQDFIAQRQQQFAALSDTMQQAPLIIAPFDAELFGHWWFEGPYWLEQVLRLASKPESNIQLVTASSYLQQGFKLQTTKPSASTWGEEGYAKFWINDSNAWIYPLLHQASEQLQQFVGELRGINLTPLQNRALNQATRSLLLAQASDWPFIMQSGTNVAYAHKRVNDYLARFKYLHDSVRSGKIDERYLTALEIMDNIFPAIDFRDYYPNDN